MLDKTLFKKCLILNARNKIKLTSLCKYTQKLQKTTNNANKKRKIYYFLIQN